MSSANNNIQVADLDFNDIKTNLISFLQSQPTFKGYNFSGSALNTLMDLLAYNTSYNAFYLNMVANEMFLDSAIQRSSVVSHAKLLNYVPQSVVAPTAIVNITFNGVTTPSFTLPQYTNFSSEAINGVNYNYLTTTSSTVAALNNTVTFNNILLKQGNHVTYTFTADSVGNPSSLFEIPDSQIDTSTLVVNVYQSSSNSAYQIFNPTTDYLSLSPSDAVYFLQESIDGNYQIYFGDGVLGQELSTGNIITVDYVSTQASAGGLANAFTLMSGNLGSYTSVVITPVLPATQGSEKESIDSIKFQAPKAFASQGRAVSKNDYISVLQQNNLGITFDAVSVWGGEENTPPSYGQVFISLKPTGSYNLSETQKQLIINEVLEPVSVLTVQPVIVDPDYTYIQVNANVLFQQSQTTMTPSNLQLGCEQAIYNYAAQNLNTFNSTFSSYAILNAIASVDQSIITSDFTIKLQKKIYPNITTPSNYTLYYNSSLIPGLFQSGVSSYPAMQFVDTNNSANIIDGVYIEEVPASTGGISSISILNPGYNYTSTPTVNIIGDGTGASAYATIINGRLSSITVTNAGSGYTSALVTLSNAPTDTTGINGALFPVLQGQYGTLRLYYNSTSLSKVILNSNIGTIDYVNGIITLNNFNPVGVDNTLGQLVISVNPTTTIVSSTYNRIITIDPYDPAAININVNVKNG